MTDESLSVAGFWVTADGRMRVHLRPDGQFDETRSDSARTFHGTWRIDGARIHFRDPTTGYEAVGELRDDVLYADGCEFRRE
jgi:hypothetical protein